MKGNWQQIWLALRLLWDLQQAGCMFFGLDFILDDGEQSVIELK